MTHVATSVADRDSHFFWRPSGLPLSEATRWSPHCQGSFVAARLKPRGRFWMRVLCFWLTPSKLCVYLLVSFKPINQGYQLQKQDTAFRIKQLGKSTHGFSAAEALPGLPQRDVEPVGRETHSGNPTSCHPKRSWRWTQDLLSLSQNQSR